MSIVSIKLEKERIKRIKFKTHFPISILLSNTNKNSVRLTEGKTYRSMEQN